MGSFLDSLLDLGRDFRGHDHQSDLIMEDSAVDFRRKPESVDRGLRIGNNSLVELVPEPYFGLRGLRDDAPMGSTPLALTRGEENGPPRDEQVVRWEQFGHSLPRNVLFNPRMVASLLQSEDHRGGPSPIVPLNLAIRRQLSQLGAPAISAKGELKRLGAATVIHVASYSGLSSRTPALPLTLGLRAMKSSGVIGMMSFFRRICSYKIHHPMNFASSSCSASTTNVPNW